MTKSLTPERLAEIKERAEKATPGPWSFYSLPQPVGFTRATIHADAGPKITTWTNELPPELGGLVLMGDAEFIAHAREDVPDLVAEVERLRVIATQNRDDWHEAVVWKQAAIAERDVVIDERDALQAKLDQVRTEVRFAWARRHVAVDVSRLRAILEGEGQS